MSASGPSGPLVVFVALHICVLIHIRTKGEVGTVKHFQDLQCSAWSWRFQEPMGASFKIKLQTLKCM